MSLSVSINELSRPIPGRQPCQSFRLVEIPIAHHLGEFLTQDAKGRRVPEFLNHLGGALKDEHDQIVREMQTLKQNIEHIKEIVAMQQSYAKVAGMMEDLPAASLVEDAIRMNEGAFLRHGVQINRQFDATPLVRVDKHKVLQIMVNAFSQCQVCPGCRWPK